MKNIVFLLLALGLTQASFCQKTTTQKLDELMQAYNIVNKFNGSILVSKKGEIVLEKGYGIKDVQSNAKNNAKGIFQIYSITKTFTSTLILKLVELKKLSLTNRLSKFYPAFPKGDSITIEQLLSHTAGVYDYTRGNNMPDQTEGSFLQFIQTKPLEFTPGSNWSYSNSGYWLLGFIIQKVSGIPYEEAVKQYIFDPLKMKASGFGFKQLRDGNKTKGYELFTDQLKKEAIVYDAPGPYAAGAIYSTVGDLYKYHKGLQNFKIVSDSSLKRAYSTIRNNYGLGWMVSTYEGRRIVSHSGGAAGYRSNFARVPEDDICIVLLNNTESANVDLITKNILKVLDNKPYKLPFEIKVSTEVLEKHIGTYQMAAPQLTMYVTVDNGRLAVQASDQQKTVLLAEKENYYFSEEARGYIEFKQGLNGEVTTMTLDQNGQKFTATRIYPTWGVLGNATEVGWDGPDIELREDTLKKGVWVLKDIKLKTGEIKFRFNNDWTVQYGDDQNDKILEWAGKDIHMEAGTYDIILDLRDQSNPKYSLVKK